MTEQRDLGAGLIARTAHHTPTCPATLDIVFPDVSSQPGAIVRQLDLTAREQAVDPNRWQHLARVTHRPAGHGSRRSPNR